MSNPHDTGTSKPDNPPPRGMGWWVKQYPDFGLICYQPHEPLERYIAGGFHPISLGDTFCQGRYTIRHRLGHGGFSSVWLANDSHQEHVSAFLSRYQGGYRLTVAHYRLWVSLKIKQAYLSTDDIEQDPDIKTLKDLEKHYTSTSMEGPRYFPQLFDYFHHSGPNGRHTCIVTELLGPTLGAVQKSYSNVFIDDEPEILRPDTILRASRQLLEAVGFSHNAGFVHGDISPSNMAFTCYGGLRSEEDFWDTIGGSPVMVEYGGPEPRPTNLPKMLVRKASWSGWYDCPDEDICLIDWGESFPVDAERSAFVAAQDATLRSPESVFVGSLDPNHDLWGAGCVIFTMFYQKYPFLYTWSQVEHIKDLCQVLGPLPPNLEAKLEKEANSESGSVSSPKLVPGESRLLDDTFEARREEVVTYRKNDQFYEKEDFDEEDFQALKLLLPLLKALMDFEPENRTSPRDAISSIDWVDHWREYHAENSGEEQSDGDGDGEEEGCYSPGAANS